MSGKGTQKNKSYLRLKPGSHSAVTITPTLPGKPTNDTTTARELGINPLDFKQLPPAQRSVVASYIGEIKEQQKEARASRNAAAAASSAGPGIAAFGSTGPQPGYEEEEDGSEVHMTIDPDIIRGVSRRDRIHWLLFRALARGDFKHDFGENEKTRDLIVPGDENRFFEIAKLVSKKGAVWLRAQFKNRAVGTNLYKLISDQINLILPKGEEGVAAAADGIPGAVPGTWASEEKLLSTMGLDWDHLKGEIAAKDDGVEIAKHFNVPGIDGGRDYVIRACRYRKSLVRTSPDYKINTAPIDALKTVTGGEATKFALIVDASGGFPLSDLRDRNLIVGGTGEEEVYIIENIENGADSATKITNIIEKPKPGTEAAAARPPAPKLRFLRDSEKTVNYPLWANSDDQKSNIYSRLEIVLNRTSDTEVDATLVIRKDDGTIAESHSIGDVSNTSNVKNASLYAVAIMLEKGVTNEVLIYTLIKRMGDWCQALSLLDRDREYRIFDGDGKTEMMGGGQTGGRRTTTLRSMQVDTEIGVVTNDRILLAFCILLGLNVFYTSAMDLARLV
jgi:hypothetical protein